MKISNRVVATMCVCLAQAIGFAGLAGTAMAGEHNDVLSVGDAAPGWKLPGVDKKEHTLEELSDSKLVVMVFTCNGCPVAKKYQPRLMEFAKEYKEKGVSLVAVHVHRGETMEHAVRHAKDAELNFLYVHDDSQSVAKSYGAKTTPHVFVLDGKRKVAYMGAIDDNMIESKVKISYLRQAVDLLLDGKVASLPETRQFGCSIKWK